LKTASIYKATTITFILAILAKENKSKKASNPKNTLTEEVQMTKYNHCQKCGKPLGFLS